VRAIIGLATVTSGAIEFEGQNLVNLGGARLTAARRNLQAVFQEPWMSLNPRMRVEEVIAEPLLVHGVSRNMSQARSRVEELLELCEMPIGSGRRRVHSFSGGQQQRIALARALALEPKLIVADEPTSALDVSVQAQIIALMKSLQVRLGVAYLIVSHDLGVVRELADVVGVMYCGRMLELADAERLFSRPASPYTQALLAASPIPDPRAERARARVVLAGEVPNPVHPPAGCRFQTRCPMVEQICREEEPTLQEKAPGQVAACWFT
jgi:oligopeptide transport system ATP-binding protein